MTDLDPTHEAIRSRWTELIQQRIANPLAKGAVWLAEYVGEKTEPDWDDEQWD